jgi:hypothetical protein
MIRRIIVSTNQESAISNPQPKSRVDQGGYTQDPVTDDTCRESQPNLTPGELRDAFFQLEKQITVKLDAYVAQAVKAKTDFDALIPLLDQLQSMLSQRGAQRRLMDTIGLPTWSKWFSAFRPRLGEDFSLRTIQRRLRKYREDPPTKDSNVIARELASEVESKKRSEKLDMVIAARDQLNPAIRQDLIRALQVAGKRLLASAEELKKGFRKLPISATGKAHQRLVREHRAKLHDPLIEEKRRLAADFENARVEQISYAAAKNIILANEYFRLDGDCQSLFRTVLWRTPRFRSLFWVDRGFKARVGSLRPRARKGSHRPGARRDGAMGTQAFGVILDRTRLRHDGAKRISHRRELQ